MTLRSVATARGGTDKLPQLVSGSPPLTNKFVSATR